MGPTGYSEKIRVGGGGVFRSEVKFFRAFFFRLLNMIKIYTVQVNGVGGGYRSEYKKVGEGGGGVTKFSVTPRPSYDMKWNSPKWVS